MDASGLRARSRLSWAHTGHGIPSAGCACCPALRPPALAVFRGFLPLPAALVGVGCSLPWSNPGSTFTLSYLQGCTGQDLCLLGTRSLGGARVAATDHWRDPGAESKPGPASRAESALAARGRVSSPPQTGALPGIHGAGRPGRQGPASSPPAEQRTGHRGLGSGRAPRPAASWARLPALPKWVLMASWAPSLRTPPQPAP